MKAILLRNWFSLVISFVSTFSPIHTVKEVVPQSQPVAVVARLPHKTLAVNPVAVTPARETAPLLASAQSYTYTFAGLATSEGQPCNNARVEVRVTSDHGADIQNVTTGKDGRYNVSIPVVGEPNETLSWEIHALTSDFKKVDLEGHQILTGEYSIQMEAPLAFVES